MSTRCRVPARWGLQQTTLATGSNETWARDPLVRLQVDKLPKIEKYGPTIGPILQRQGEPGTSQYIHRNLPSPTILMIQWSS